MISPLPPPKKKNICFSATQRVHHRFLQAASAQAQGALEVFALHGPFPARPPENDGTDFCLRAFKTFKWLAFQKPIWVEYEKLGEIHVHSLGCSSSIKLTHTFIPKPMFSSQSCSSSRNIRKCYMHTKCGIYINIYIYTHISLYIIMRIEHCSCLENVKIPTIAHTTS